MTACATIAIVILVAACGPAPITLTAGPTATPAATPPPTTLAMDATGLGPCKEQWYTTCNYGIRGEGPGDYDHRGNFAWDEGPRPGLDHGPNGNVASTGVYGGSAEDPRAGCLDHQFPPLVRVGCHLYGSPVPGGTPRYVEEDPFTAACSTEVDTAVVASATLHVAFERSSCTVRMETVAR